MHVFVNDFDFSFRISLLFLNTKLGQLKTELLAEYDKLKAKIEFFNSR